MVAIIEGPYSRCTIEYFSGACFGNSHWIFVRFVLTHGSLKAVGAKRFNKSCVDVVSRRAASHHLVLHAART